MRTGAVPADHVCPRGQRWGLTDARGIFCCYVCEVCEAEKAARYRPEIFADADYGATEAIDED